MTDSEKCPNCQKRFSSHQRYQYHISHNCCQREPNTCLKCQKIFSSHQKHQQHVNNQVCLKKQKISIPIITPDQLELERIKLQQQQEKRMTEEAICRQEEQRTLQLELGLQLQQTKIKLKLRAKNCNNHNGNNNSNNHINIQQQNIHIQHPLPFGKEDLSILDDLTFILEVLNKPARFHELVTSQIYCDQNNPKNMTVYIPNRDPSIAMVSDGQQFCHQNAKETVDKIFNLAQEKKVDYLEEHSDRLSSLKKHFHQEIDESDVHLKMVRKNIRNKLMDMEKPVKKLLNLIHQTVQIEC